MKNLVQAIAQNNLWAKWIAANSATKTGCVCVTSTGKTGCVCITNPGSSAKSGCIS